MKTNMCQENSDDTPKIIFALGRLDIVASGVSYSVPQLASTLTQAGAPVDIYTAVCGNSKLIRHMLPDNVNYVAPGGLWLGGLSYSPKLKRSLNAVMPDTDVVHIHSLWMLPNSYASSVAYKHKKPLVVSPRGSLEPFCLKCSWWKKAIVKTWFQNRDLRRAACFHALTSHEANSIREYGITAPIAVIPNGIHLPADDLRTDRAAFDAICPTAAGKRICLFMARLHQIKGLDHLLKAWARVAPDNQDWHLVIAGPDDGAEASSKKLAKDLGIEQSTTFPGPLFDYKKHAALSAADFFVLPSHSEGFSLALLEALAWKLPAMITPNCRFPNVAEVGAGIEANPTPDDTEQGLRKMMSMSKSELDEMGQRGRKMVEAGFTWEQIAQKYIELYRWLCKKQSTQPPFIELA